MSNPIDVRTPAIKRMEHQQLPLAELREKLCKEREATKELTDEIKRLAKRAREADHGATHLWLVNHASCLERIVSEYENKNESL
jgi:Mg2+ and Co2+ transporter CorA